MFIAFHFLVAAMLLSTFSKAGIEIEELFHMFSPIEKTFEEQYNKVDFNENIYNLLKTSKTPLYEFKNKNEVSFEKIKKEYSENNLEAFNGHNDYPTEGSNEEKKQFIQNQFTEEYQKDNYTYIFSEENGNFLFEILDENNNFVLSDKILANKDIFYSFSENLNTYYNFNEIDNVFFLPDQSNKIVITNNREEESISILDISYLSTNNTFSSFLYKGNIMDQVNLKSVSIFDNKVRIFNYNYNMNQNELFATQNELINELNKFIIFYTLFFIWSVTSIPLFRKYLRYESKRREAIVFSSPYKNQLLLEDKREKQKIKQNKKVSVMSI